MDYYKKQEVHIFSLEGQRFLFEVNSLRICEIDELTEKILSCSEELSLENILKQFAGEYQPEELTDLVHTLVELQFLIKDNGDMKGTKELPLRKGKSGLSNLVLNISQKCNMNCTYCYADGGTYNTPEQLMNKKTGEACVDFLLDASDEKTCWIYFFGGEPLLNADVMLHVVEYGKARASILGKELRFGITTNGTLLNDELLKCFVDNNFSIMLSLDGPKALQDSQRTFKAGKGSYDIIAPNLKELVSHKELTVGCRCTVTPKNLKLQEIDEHFLDCGVKYYHIEPATFGPFTWGDDPAFEEVEMQKYLEQYGDLIKSTWSRVKNKDFVAYRPIFAEIIMLDKKEGKEYPCGMGTNMLCASAEGELFNCHRLVGMKEQVLGSVFDPDMKETIKKYTPVRTEEKEGCVDCWARNICAGDCPAESIIVNHDEYKPVFRRCTLRKNRIEWAIWLYSNIKALSDKSLAKDILSNEFYANGTYR